MPMNRRKKVKKRMKRLREERLKMAAKVAERLLGKNKSPIAEWNWEWKYWEPKK